MFHGPAFWRGFRIGAACGLIVGGIAFCTPTRAEPFATVSAGKVVVTLRTDQGPCVGRARLATFMIIGSDDPPVPGCWALEGDQVAISWLDGDRGNIPVGKLVKVKAS